MTDDPQRIEALRTLLRDLLNRNNQLQTALESRVVIEQAKGILAERLRMGVEDAFAVLRRAARSSRMRIHDLAREVVSSRHTPAPVLEAARAVEPRIVGDLDDTGRSDLRIAENQALFRRVNEQLKAAEEPIGSEARLQFLCECGDPSCTDFVSLSVEEYEAIRADPRRFVVVRGHEELWVERVLDRRDGYVVVEKRMPTGALAEDLDPRGDEVT